MNLKIVDKMAQLILAQNARRQGGVCGQAFSNYNCAICLKEGTHHNTATPLLCDECRGELIKIRNNVAGSSATASEALAQIAKKDPRKVSREEAADMAVEFHILAREASK